MGDRKASHGILKVPCDSRQMTEVTPLSGSWSVAGFNSSGEGGSRDEAQQRDSN